MITTLVCACFLGLAIAYIMIEQKKKMNNQNKDSKLKQQCQIKSNVAKLYPSNSKKKEAQVEVKVSQAAKVIYLNERKKDRNAEMNKTNKKRLP